MHKNKVLVSIVLLLSLVIIAGMSVLVYGLYKKANDPSFNFFKQAAKKRDIPAKTSNTTIEKNISITLTNGEWISNIVTSQNRIIVHITNKFKNDSLLILDATNGTIISHVKFKHRR